MALEVVGGAFLSASLQALFAEIRSIVDFVRRHKVNEELLKQLRIKLLLANGVLGDAERQQITKSDVREWLQVLNDAIHDAEDLVDEIKTEALRRQHKADRHLDRVRNFFSSRSAVMDVERRIENIIKSVDGIVQDMNLLGLREGVQTSIPFQIQRSSQNILAEESDVYGREHEKEAIIKFLSSDGGHKISVMTIVGMAGIGKTTLAQLVYRDVIDGKAVMEKHFDIKEWITVADESKSHVFTLTKAIYEAVNGPLDNTIKETFQHQLKLKEALQGKKFLFVFDDVWNVDRRTWELIQKSFESAANGSKIIVTTRLPEIEKNLATPGSETLDLALLSDDDGWKLFSKHAFNNVETSSYPRLEEIGKKIVEKCSGNPLAVRTLACLLYSQLNPREWEKVLVNDIWELDQGEGDILPALWLSYYYLPRHLKRCFAYCSIIPKDTLFEKERLILLWMAENLLQPQNNTTLEEVGEKYFEDLTSRSFFIVNHYGAFTMHDLVNDLAKFVSGESCMRLGDNCSGNLIRTTRHISCMADDDTSDISKKLEDLSKNKVLRTLLVLEDRSWNDLTQYNINPKVLRSMQCLRVLSASRKFFRFEGRSKLFKSIGSLKLLRYLDLSYNHEIKEIPDTICELYNLQTLLLVECENLAKLPDSIGNLKQLRDLYLSGCEVLVKLPDSIGNLKQLRHLYLSGCEVLVKLPDSIGNLKQLRHLDLSKSSIEKMPDTICNLHELRALSLSGCEVLVKLSDSIGNLKQLRYLDLSSCSKLTQLPTNISMLTNLWKLDNTGTSLKEMPPKISKLKNLRSLPEFVVGKINDIEELGELPDLHGRLCIRSLENVEEVEDVSKANLKTKNHITDLELKWNDDSNDVSHNKAREVLDRLQPHTNIEQLRIENYRGRSFPDWIGHHSFSCIREVVLKGGKNCDRLPPLGELPSLEDLRIVGFDMVERIGDEFYLNDSSSSSASCVTEPPFKSLKKLVFEDMGEWKEWSLVGGAFPNLKTLKLRGCPKLKGECLPDYLPSLEHLEIWDNHHVVASLSTCQYPSLRKLDIYNCPGMKSFPQGRLPSTIQTIRIERCDDLESLSEEGWPCSNLKSLHIERCKKLSAHSNKWNLGMFTSLTYLHIFGDCLESLLEEGWPCSNLESLHIGGCKKLFAHSNKWNLGMLTSLTHLNIWNVKEGMDSFPEEEGQLPTALTLLCLSGIENLKSLNGTALQHLTSLHSLWIRECQQLQCLPEERLPASLSYLDICDCPLLTPRCQRGKGQDWDKIRHISEILIDDKRI